MAKKNVSKMGKESKNMVKLIRSVKNPETGRYNFKEEMVPKEKVNEYLKKK